LGASNYSIFKVRTCAFETATYQAGIKMNWYRRKTGILAFFSVPKHFLQH